MQSATYCPEDNKLRLYVGRVPRDEYEKLRAEGWTSTPKQGCDFVAPWTPQRRDTALSYSDDGIIEDEDQSPEDRAADRAERFGDYRDRRTADATGHADRYDAGPLAHGFQNARRAERAAARHDRIGDRATDAWGRAEYWQRRTAGVIRHALYKSTPGVRMGRIKTLEAELRKHVASLEKCAANWRAWCRLRDVADAEKQTALVRRHVGSVHHSSEYPHPRPETITNTYRRERGAHDLYDLMTMVERDLGTSDITGAEACALFFSDHREPAMEDEWTQHYALRLAYENQMLEAQGGRAAFVEMEPGGFIGQHQIRKVNKSAATGRVVSVTVAVPSHGRDRWGNEVPNAPKYWLRVLNVERLPEDAYRPPTHEERATYHAAIAAEKKKARETGPAPIPLINPTDADAGRLMALWNEREKARHEAAVAARKCDSEFVPGQIVRITQAQYSAASKGALARCETRGVCADGELRERQTDMYSSTT